jgi:hypothetical protein
MEGLRGRRGAASAFGCALGLARGDRAFAFACGWAFALLVAPAHEARAAAPARDERAADGEHGDGEPPRTYVALRAGASTGNLSGQPEVCGEVAPLSFLSIVACGTGSGLWTASPGREISHYRVDVHLPALRLGEASVKALVGAGFSELQLAADDPGFRFSSTGPRGLETAGASAATTLRGSWPVASGFEALADLTLGVAHFPEAGRLAQPQPTVLPFLSLGVGAGF